MRHALSTPRDATAPMPLVVDEMIDLPNGRRSAHHRLRIWHAASRTPVVLVSHVAGCRPPAQAAKLMASRVFAEFLGFNGPCARMAYFEWSGSRYAAHDFFGGD